MKFWKCENRQEKLKSQYYIPINRTKGVISSDFYQFLVVNKLNYRENSDGDDTENEIRSDSSEGSIEKVIELSKQKKKLKDKVLVPIRKKDVELVDGQSTKSSVDEGAVAVGGGSFFGFLEILF